MGKNFHGNTLNNCLLLTEVYNCNKIINIIQIYTGYDWSMFGSCYMVYLFFITIERVFYAFYFSKFIDAGRLHNMYPLLST